MIQRAGSLMPVQVARLISATPLSRLWGGALRVRQQQQGPPLKGLRDPQGQQQLHGVGHEPRGLEAPVPVRAGQGRRFRSA